MLRYGYHFLSACIISLVLLITLAIMDVLLVHTHLTLLLINVDFLAPPSQIPLILEILIHFLIGVVIYIVFLAIYKINLPFYYISYILLLIIFAMLYPLLVAIAQRDFFTFSWLEYGMWMIAHLIFAFLMFVSIPSISRKSF